MERVVAFIFLLSKQYTLPQFSSTSPEDGNLDLSSNVSNEPPKRSMCLEIASVLVSLPLLFPAKYARHSRLPI